MKGDPVGMVALNGWSFKAGFSLKKSVSMKNEIQDPKIKTICFGKTSHTIERNKEIVKMLSEDKRPEQIAKDMCMGLWAVRKSIQRMMELNGYRSVWGLVAAAIRGNFIY